MHIRPTLLIAIAAGLLTACGDEPIGPPGQDRTPSPPRPEFDQAAVQNPFADRHTPFQQALIRSIADRQARGLPVPESVAYTFEEQPAAAPGAMMRLEGVDGQIGQGIEATTTVRFASAAQAGLTQWPALVVRGAMPEGASGYINEGDYSETVRQQIAAQYPNTNVDFDTGPRTFTVTETITDKTPLETPSLLGLTNQGLRSLTTSGGMLMGFTIPGPGIDYHVEYDLDVCIIWFFGCVVEWDVVDFWAGFVLDWTIITRLPMDVSVTSVDPVEEGSVFTPTTAATGLDWAATDYTNAGLAAENGNEFVLRFQFGLGIFLTVSYIPVIDWGIPPIDIERFASFTTPLGSGQMFSLPSINLSLWNIDVALAEADLGVQLTPLLGSDRFTADWTATGNGSGSVTYTTSGQSVALGAIQADDGPGNAAVDLSNFRYHFTQFGLDVGLYFYLWVAGWDHTWTIPVTQFDLGGLMGGLYVGTHSGTPGTLNLLVPFTNVAPTAMISRVGTINVGGQPVFLLPAGGTLALTGDAYDPGADDLALTWDWNDGALDQATYPVPHSVREERTHQFGGACVYNVGFTAQDDDGATGSDHVPVLVTGAAGNLAKLEGWWQHQLGRQGENTLDEATLACYLAVAAHMSSVLGEARDISSIRRAHDVLFMRWNAGDPREQFDRELLVAWLNFAHGAIEYDELVDTDDDLVPDTPFSEIMSDAEASRLNPVTAASQIRRFTRILHQISVASIS